jgi:uncharacterized lipoprotein NlpE involved in copper resistance
MKRKYSSKLLVIGASLAVLIACKSGTAEGEVSVGVVDSTETKSDGEAQTTPPDGSNAQIALDYTGTYKGIVPCADCEGIITQLTLGADSTYELTLQYKGKGDGKPVVSKGTYNWKDGNTISLAGVTGGAFLYKVEENRLRQLDTEGRKIEGALAENYVLTKVQ